MDLKLKVKGEWYFEEGETIRGPFSNFVTVTGVQRMATLIQGLSSPFLVLGTDITTGEVITEVFRKPVSSVLVSGNLVRFRTQLFPEEANGNFQKASIFVEGTSTPSTGIMFNLLRRPFSKSTNTVMTIEARITIQGGE